jgi:hypothetical protein
MKTRFVRGAVTFGALLLLGSWAAPARADGINVMRFLVHNQLKPQKPTWLGRAVVQPFKEYRQAKRDVKRLRGSCAAFERTYRKASGQAFNKRFTPRSTIFGFAAAVAKANKAGRMAVITKAKACDRHKLSPLTLNYYQRNLAKRR